jgi:hypothetical protein
MEIFLIGFELGHVHAELQVAFCFFSLGRLIFLERGVAKRITRFDGARSRSLPSVYPVRLWQ